MPLPPYDHRLRSLSRRRPARLFRLALLLALAALPFVSSCKRSSFSANKDVLYVAVPETVLRDRLAVVYNRVGTVKNGDRLEVLERQRRFARVRTAQHLEGWIALRCLVSADVYEKFQQMGALYRDAPVQSHGLTRFAANMHVAPGRDTPTLYQLAANSKIELLRRATSERASREEIADAKADEIAELAGEPVHKAPEKAAKAASSASSTPSTAPADAAKPAAAPAAAPEAAQRPAPESKPEAMDDWWLVRDAEGHTGWVLAGLIFADIPLDVAQYAEGERIQAAFVLNSVDDSVKGKVKQYLCLLNANRDGIPYDFEQIRVFTWNLKKHRYETAYRERHILGYFPATVSTENFGKEGDMPVFTVRLQNVDGSITPRKYRIIGNIVRPVLEPGQSFQQAAHSTDDGVKPLPKKSPKAAKRRGHPWW